MLTMGYPDEQSEVEILKGRQGKNPLDDVNVVASKDDIALMQKISETIYTDDKVYEYIAALANATRNNDMIELGLSPRGSIAITRLARAHAFLAGRGYVTPDDVCDVFLDASIHRVTLSPKAKIANVTVTDVLKDILKQVHLPKITK